MKELRNKQNKSLVRKRYWKIFK